MSSATRLLIYEAPDVTKYDYSRSKGAQALAARLRRVSERIDRDGTRIYASNGVVFEQRWYGVLRQIVERGPSAIGDIASAMRITHASVSAASTSLEKAGFVVSMPDPADRRRRVLELTEAGEKLVQQLTPLWEAFNAAASELNDEAGDIVAGLNRLEDALDERSMFERIASRVADCRS